MSTGIQAAPDLKVKYVRRVKEDSRERENMKVEASEEREQYDDVGSQKYGTYETNNTADVIREKQSELLSSC